MILVLLGLLSTKAFAEEIEACKSPYTTQDLNHCASLKLEAANNELDKYFKTALKHNEDDPELVKSIKVAQAKWQEYLSAHCSSVGVTWRGGTIRGVKYLNCEITLTKQRTHELWENFLTYMDSTPPVLPEPKKDSN